MRFQIKSGFTDGAFHRSADRTHLGGGNFVGNTEPRPKRFIHFGRTEQMKRHFLTAGPINVEIWRTGKARVFFEEAKRLPVLPKRSQKAGILFSRELNHPQLGDHNRPAEDRTDREQEENELAGSRGMLKGKEQAAGR